MDYHLPLVHLVDPNVYYDNYSFPGGGYGPQGSLYFHQILQPNIIETKSLNNDNSYEVTAELIHTNSQGGYRDYVLTEDISYTVDFTTDNSNVIRSAIIQINSEMGYDANPSTTDWNAPFNEESWNNNWTVANGYKPTYQEITQKVNLGLVTPPRRPRRFHSRFQPEERWLP